jgi:hypothetical protein
MDPDGAALEPIGPRAIPCHAGRVSTIADTAEAPSSPERVEPSSFARRRLWLLAGVVLLLAVAGVVVFRPRAVTPVEFAEFSQKLSTLAAPSDSFMAYDPNLSSYLGSAPQGSWLPVSADTWANTSDPSWWVTSRGWEITVPAGQSAAVCSDVTVWLASTGTALGLTTPGQNETVSGCLSSVATVRSDVGNSNVAWSGRGTRTGDGQPRYLTGAESFTGTHPGEVVIRVTAEATVATR